MLKYVSVCSGIEAATVAWHPLGWVPLAFAEIGKFPSAVLATHYPHVPNYGDLTKFRNWIDDAVDLLVGGTPCQAFSFAGLRKGLDDPRGNLTLTFLALARKYRPRWVVWENVPGVLSDRTNAFGQFLAGLGELGYGWCYRVLDAQFFGVPQRRRRVFVVAYLGDWRRAAAVLFEPESLRGDSTPSRQSGDSTTGTIGARTGRSIGAQDAGCGHLIAHAVTCHQAKGGDPTTDNYVVAHTLRGEGFDASEDGSGRGTPLVPVAFSAKDCGSDVGEISPTLRAGGHTGSHANGGVMPAISYGLGVRRVTPRECERLQGFPDDYTAIQYNGKPAKDGPRYKALGNSMAVPVMAWIGRRIAIADTL